MIWRLCKWECDSGGKPNEACQESERIIDWITLDSQITWFPDADRDNFGADFGMLDYDFNWYIGGSVFVGVRWLL